MTSLRTQIVERTSDPKKQLDLLWEMTLGNLSEPNDPIESARLIQAGFGGPHDEDGLMNHLRNLILTTLDKEAEKEGSKYVEYPFHMFAVLIQIKNDKLFQALQSKNLPETNFNNITIGDEVETRIKNGEFDAEILEKLRERLPKVTLTWYRRYH